MINVLTAWKAVQSEATVTGDEVLGESECKGSAWKAVRLWQCIKSRSFGVVPSRHIVFVSPFRALRTRLSSLRSVVPSRHLAHNSINAYIILLYTLALALPAYGQTKQKTATERGIERQGFVDIKAIDPSIRVSLMYTRADNFTGQVLYTDLHTAYLHPAAAAALKKAQAELKRLRPDLSLCVCDAARPMSVQQKMYDVVRGTSKAIYVSNPKNGGGLHNYGLAVDVTLCVAATGDTLHMGTKVDYLGELAHVKGEAEFVKKKLISQEALQNRQLLRKAMAAAGYKVLNTEWWHFNFKSRAEAKANYKVIK